MKTGKIATLTLTVLVVVMFAGAAYCFLGGADPSRNMGNYRSFSFYADRPGNAAAGWFQPGAAPPNPWDEFWFDNSGNFNLSGGLSMPGPLGMGTQGQLRYSGGNLQYSNDGGSTFTNMGASPFAGWSSGGTGILQGQSASSPSNPSNEFWFDNQGNFNLSGGMSTPGPVSLGTTGYFADGHMPASVQAWHSLVTGSDYTGAINAANTYATNNNVPLLFPPGNYTISSNITFTAFVIMQPGAVIANSTQTLVFSGGFDARDRQQHWSGTGAVTFASAPPTGIFPEWWTTNAIPDSTDMTSAINAAWQSCSTGAVVRLACQTYKITGLISSGAPGPFTLEGVAEYFSTAGTVIDWKGSPGTQGSQLTAIFLYGGNHLNNIFVNNSGSAAYVNGVVLDGSVDTLNHSSNVICRKVEVNGFYNNWYLNYCWYNSFYDCRGRYGQYGINMGQSVNNCCFINFHATMNLSNISDEACPSRYATQANQFICPSIELGQQWGLDLQNHPEGWVIDCPYFESNAQNRISGSVIIHGGEESGDGIPGMTPGYHGTLLPEFLITGSDGIRIEDLWSSSTSVTNLFTFGTELTASSDSITSPGWTGSYPSFTNNLANTSALVDSTVAPVPGHIYTLQYTISGNTGGGTVTITFGGLSTGAVSGSGVFVGTATSSSGSYTITPTSMFNGAIYVSIRDNIYPVTNYENHSIYIEGNMYNGPAVQTGFAECAAALGGSMFDPAMYRSVDSGWFTASTTGFTWNLIAAMDSWQGTSQLYAIAAYLVVQTPVTFSSGSFTVNLGRSGPAYNDVATFSTSASSLAAGVYPMTMAELPVQLTPAWGSAYSYKIYQAANSGITAGEYKVVLITQ